MDPQTTLLKSTHGQLREKGENYLVWKTRVTAVLRVTSRLSFSYL